MLKREEKQRKGGEEGTNEGTAKWEKLADEQQRNEKGKWKVSVCCLHCYLEYTLKNLEAVCFPVVQ